MKKMMIFLMFALCFSAFAAESKSDKPDSVADSVQVPKITFIELGSVNCIPCKMMQPVMKEIEKEYEAVAEVCLELGALDVFISDTLERQESIWSALAAFLEAIKGSTTDMDECDVVVPRNKIAPFLKFSNSLREKYNIRINDNLNHLVLILLWFYSIVLF